DEEIFGPILPIISYQSLDDLIVKQRQLAKPLATYIFTENHETANYILEKLTLVGGCSNECFMKLNSIYLPFIDKGASGMDNYHGKASFDTFSHSKSILKNTSKIDIPIRYLPFNQAKLKILKRIFG